MCSEFESSILLVLIVKISNVSNPALLNKLLGYTLSLFAERDVDNCPRTSLKSFYQRHFNWLCL